MLKREKEIIGIIRYIAFDDRHRVLVEDELEWMEEKMKEINAAYHHFKTKNNTN